MSIDYKLATVYLASLCDLDPLPPSFLLTNAQPSKLFLCLPSLQLLWKPKVADIIFTRKILSTCLIPKITSALQAIAVVSSHLLTRRMYSIWHWQQGAHWYILSPLTNKKRERIILWTPSYFEKLTTWLMSP